MVTLLHMTGTEAANKDRHERILDAVVRLIGQGGISAVSMRAVAREAEVSLGLVNYHYTDKVGLIREALLRIGEDDVAMLAPDPTLGPEERLRAALRRFSDPEFLTTEYVSLRLQLWSLATAHKDFEQINTAAQKRYRKTLSGLIAAARPGLSRSECNRRAGDIDIIQNGVWLTTLLGLQKSAAGRSVALCEEIAFAN